MLNLDGTRMIKNCKLTEAFCSFIEKISYHSNDCHSNLENIANFKREILMNIQAHKKLNQMYPVAEKRPEHKSSLQLNENTILSTRETSPCTFETSVPSLNSPQISAFDDQSSLSILRAPSYAESSGKRDCEESIDVLGLPTNPSWTKTLTKDQFFGQVKPSYHVEMNKITSSLNDVGFARKFDSVSETTFYALCFAFFESYIKEVLNNPRVSLYEFISLRLGSCDGNIQQSLGYLESQFASLTRSWSRRNNGESEVITSFYDMIAANYEFYKCCLVVFKKIIVKILEQNYLDTSTRKTSLHWISDISNAEKSFYESLTRLYKTNLQFLVLTPTKLIEKRFTLEQTPLSVGLNPSKSQELKIFIDKFLASTYILHRLENQNSFDFRLERQRSYSPNISREPSFLNVLQETLKGKSKEGEQPKNKKSLTSSQIKKLVLPPRPNPLNLISNLVAKKPDSVVENSILKRYPTPAPGPGNYYFANPHPHKTYTLDHKETKSDQNIPKPLSLQIKENKGSRVKVESLYDKLIREINQKAENTRADLTRNMPPKEEKVGHHQRTHSYSESTKNHFEINLEQLARGNKEPKKMFEGKKVRLFIFQ